MDDEAGATVVQHGRASWIAIYSLPLLSVRPLFESSLAERVTVISDPRTQPLTFDSLTASTVQPGNPNPTPQSETHI